jgi:hypothetical protein
VDMECLRVEISYSLFIYMLCYLYCDEAQKNIIRLENNKRKLKTMKEEKKRKKRTQVEG